MTYGPYSDDESRWKAVYNRDANADCAFVYSVRTTKIFCRPVCKARLPRRSNVEFYPTPLEAQRVGYRACKRCKPELSSYMPEEVAVKKIQEFLSRPANHQDSSLMTLEAMAKQTALSKWHFHRVFKRVVGLTPRQYAQSRHPVFDAMENSETPGTPDTLELLLDTSSSSPLSAIDHPTEILGSTKEFWQPWENLDVPNEQIEHWFPIDYEQTLATTQWNFDPTLVDLI